MPVVLRSSRETCLRAQPPMSTMAVKGEKGRDSGRSGEDPESDGGTAVIPNE